MSLNVNGLRAALSKGLADWVAVTNPDVLCLQEIKTDAQTFAQTCAQYLAQYHAFAAPAEKKGYSGVAILSKSVPAWVRSGCGIPVYDVEGRVIVALIDGVAIMNVYMPSGTQGQIRQAFKERMMAELMPVFSEHRTQHSKPVLLGDFNICHTDLDIHHPQKHIKMSGFLPQERAWFSELVASGWIDPFRLLYPNDIAYSWWTYRAGARAKNLGWRIDYILVGDRAQNYIGEYTHHNTLFCSDHCPVSLLLKCD